jgi:tRNA splicing endonuclease
MTQTDDQMDAAIASWLKDDDYPGDPIQLRGVFSDEEQRERRWNELEAIAREFIEDYGVYAMLRCVGRACE